MDLLSISFRPIGNLLVHVHDLVEEPHQTQKVWLSLNATFITLIPKSGKS